MKHQNPVLGQKAVASPGDIKEKVDIVDVFRRSEDTPPLADDAVKIGARVLRLQLGISNEDAAKRATAGGLTVVMDRCIGQTVRAMGVVSRGGR